MNRDNLKILSLFMFLYNCLWKIVLPLMKKHPRLSSTFETRLCPSSYEPAQIWIQAASAGESKIAAALIKDLSISEQVKILITTFTDQGMEILQQVKKQSHTPNVQLNWFPFDNPSSIEKILDCISPSCVILLETEIWPGLFFALKKRKISILIINARMSKKSFKRYRATRFLWSKLCPDQILAVSSLDASRFQTIFPESIVEIMPNIKFSYLSSNTQQIKTSQGLSLLEKFIPTNIKLSVFASIRQQEESEVIKMIKILLNKYPNQILALFPRHMHRIKAWQSHLKEADIKFSLRSKLAQGSEIYFQPSQVILWDLFGEMSNIFPRAQVAFMGGSLYPLGGQNFMEPLLCGVSTIIGPYTEDFSWVGQDIFSKNIVQKANGSAHAISLILSVLEGEENRSQIKKKAEDYTARFQGGAQLAWEKIMESSNFS